MHFLSSNLVLTQKRWRFSEIVCFFFTLACIVYCCKKGKDSYEKKLKKKRTVKKDSFGHKMEMPFKFSLIQLLFWSEFQKNSALIRDNPTV